MRPEPRILAFDTSAAHCAAALLVGDQIVASAQEDMARGQAERLFPLLEEMLAAGGLGWSALDALGVGIGPGNFTGIRISVSAARGLALSLGLPAVGISGFETRAFGQDPPFAAWIEAPRDQAYVQVYNASEIEPPRMMPRADLEQLPVPLLNSDAAQHNPAEFIARLTAQRYQDHPARPAPLYIRPADAAPRRDPPVPILP